MSAERGVPDAAAALDGARAILAERFGEDADLIGVLRDRMWSRGRLVSKVRDGRQEAGAKFSDYFEFAEPFTRLPAHRILALLRGEKEEVLDLELDPGDSAAEGATGDYETLIAERFGIADKGRAADHWLGETVRWAWRTRIQARLGVDLRMRLWQGAEEDSVGVFAANLRDLLLAAPAGARPTMGLDPGFRTGVKVAVVDETGQAVATDTIYPHELRRRAAPGQGAQWAASLETLARLAAAHRVELIAIGNGTASRETDRLAAELIKAHPELSLTKIVVSEAGASVYSASEYAARELPGMDVSLRGAVSIARRLQDPLAELVKIDPKSIGVGQYQHDLTEGKLSRSLDAVVEDCVNAVGVDVNTASAPLLARVSGIGDGLAIAIVAHRNAAGPFPSRTALTEVPRLGPKAFEQSAGFLRIRGGDEPLDASSVHPEAYPVARRILAAAGTTMPGLSENTAVLRTLPPQDFTDDQFGLPTVRDILAELEKPGRDPRPTFTTASFAEGVETLEDLSAGLILEGVVTNVAAFGAFVDVGVHQDGLVHVSAMSRTFVSDPHTVVKSGDVVRVKVLAVDVPRKRISLTLRLDDNPDGTPAAPAPRPAGSRPAGSRPAGSARPHVPRASAPPAMARAAIRPAPSAGSVPPAVAQVAVAQVAAVRAVTALAAAPAVPAAPARAAARVHRTRTVRAPAPTLRRAAPRTGARQPMAETARTLVPGLMPGPGPAAAARAPGARGRPGSSDERPGGSPGRPAGSGRPGSSADRRAAPVTVRAAPVTVRVALAAVRVAPATVRVAPVGRPGRLRRPSGRLRRPSGQLRRPPRQFRRPSGSRQSSRPRRRRSWARAAVAALAGGTAPMAAAVRVAAVAPERTAGLVAGASRRATGPWPRRSAAPASPGPAATAPPTAISPAGATAPDLRPQCAFRIPFFMIATDRGRKSARNRSRS